MNYVSNDQYSLLSNVRVYPLLDSIFEVAGIKYVPISETDNTCDAIDCVYSELAKDMVIEDTLLHNGVKMILNELLPYTCYKNSYIKNCKIDINIPISEYAFSQSGVVDMNILATSIGVSAFNGCSNMERLILSGVKGISSYSFANCSKLLDLSLSKELELLDSYAFSNCSSLKKVEIPDSVMTIGSYSFLECTSLDSINIGKGVQQIERGAFHNCTSLDEVVIPQNVISLGEYVFRGCTSLANVIINDRGNTLSLSSNGGYPLFADCPLDSVYIGGNFLLDENSQPFSGNKTLRSVVVNGNRASIYDREFMNCENLQSVVIGDSVKSIGASAFNSCSSLSVIKLGKSVIDIGGSAFNSCSSLSTIDITGSVESLGNSAFAFCSGLVSVSMGESLKTIGESAFAYCTSLLQVKIPDSVTELGNSSFVGCEGLLSIDIGKSIKNISKETFYKCYNLSSVTIPDSVQTIGIRAFAYCENLSSVNIGQSVVDIGYMAFSCCSSLTKIELPDSVKNIGNESFSYCKNLKYFSFGEGLQTIKGTPFYYCSSMEYIVGKAVTPPVCESYSYVFRYIDKTSCKLYVPKESIAAYKVANGWKDFFNINELSGITDVIDTENIRVLSRDGEILVIGVENRVNVEIYDINGACVYSGSDTVIPVNGKGVYVVVVNGKAHKVLL